MFRGVLATAVATTVLAAVPASADEVTGPIDLGTLPGGSSSSGLLVTDRGTVFGEAYDKAFDVHGARWDPAGRITDLRPLDGYSAVKATALSEAGVAVGDSTNHVNTGRATRWDASGLPVELDQPTGFPGYAWSTPVAINEGGMVAGTAYGAPGPDAAVRWDTSGKVTVLGLGRVRAMNDAGAVISESTYWDPAGNVVELTDGGSLRDLDNAGTVVGSIGVHAAKWDSTGRPTVLDTTWESSEALAVTAGGTIAGEVRDKDFTTRIARWDPAGTLTVFEAPGSRFTAVSSSGAVLGQLGDGTAVVWDRAGRVLRLPVPEGGICSADGLNDWEVTGSCSVPGRNSHAVLWRFGEPVGNRAR
ncbi:hypothetical protein ACIRSS_43400 [Amycolatopsis sp. NPDC101161]|uniref:hypothetical protein n=1 Tax=Amycolatopsis sp. NPDC101161 TaxID=3363940 RepID=UPI0037F7FD67